ncbi:PREDICTED: serine/threonine-protein kinase VRK1-like [Dufourea novaeangliae]|uniref:serine/threonine-protein kinase VRK1-like n=1 Tax=Dufourea novaeangliae TaxID=178035 RepID=UPI000767A1B9|nr:PREDICTED: serine/threonine-protein kinase VRK1-like [Dufourea novaeangliae]XP_015435994.1 PREDICTED: serine/threonine-protein kinase VRK1-like [Dufourea novaeangliae]
MPPRKTAKHADAEVVDRVAEAGDLSPPKRKKISAKTASKSDEEKQVRLPRAAKSAKIEQTDIANTAPVVTKNAKPVNKTMSAKNVPTKANSKVKASAARKTKDVEETADTGSSKSKSREKAKKGIAESIESLEVPTTKKTKQANTKAVSKENNTKAKATRKKAGVDNDVKEKPSAVVRTTKKVASNKPVKATSRNTRGRKNMVSPEDASKDEDDSKVTGESSSSEAVNTSDNENQEVQSNQLEGTESIQLTKRGKNVKKKEETAQQKKVTKNRGKTVNHNNIPKSLEENNHKEEDSEQEETKITKSSEMVEKADEATTKKEVNENNVMNSPVNEEEN